MILRHRLWRVGIVVALAVGMALSVLGNSAVTAASPAPQPVSVASGASTVARAREAPVAGAVPATWSGPAALATTPPMGWDGFNRFGTHVTAAMVEANARALVSSGMKAAGYQYVIVDGGWNLIRRGADGQLLPNPALFPQGIAPVAAYVHSLGLKFGLYASAGRVNCAGTSAGSYGHYLRDAATFAAWGVNLVKLDWCAIPYGAYPGLSHAQVSRLLALQFAKALAATHTPILLEVNDTSPATQSDWLWAPPVATVWRTTRDIRPNWPSVIEHFTANVGLYRYASPGHWNSPDFLELGNRGLNPAEAQSQMTLWAEMATPLVAGNDLTDMPPWTRAILTNRAVIAVDQDPLGLAARPLTGADGRWVLSKPLAGGRRAVVLFNATASPAAISTTAAAVGARPTHIYTLVNAWTGAQAQTTGTIRATVEPHAAVMVIVEPLPAHATAA